MALITCPECGKQISDKAKTCLNCGCPVSDMNNENAEDQSTPEVNANNVAGKMMNMVQSGIQTALENNKNAIHVTKTVGPVQIDEPHQKFRINGSVSVNGKKDGLGKSMFKGVMAVGTLGMSVAAEKIVGGGNKQKVGNKEWLDFSDLISYDLLEDDSLVTSGGVGQALIGGALFGGFGAVAGGITGKKVQKKKVESMIIKVTVNNFDSPCIMIPLITKSTKTNSKEYQTAFNEAHNILAALDVITHNK